MAMNIFEEHLAQCKDVRRIISETIQLENYIFRKQNKYAEPQSLNDLELGMDILPELAIFVK
jgi:hypothetical protein